LGPATSARSLANVVEDSQEVSCQIQPGPPSI
jgi:hypothetical protein